MTNADALLAAVTSGFDPLQTSHLNCPDSAKADHSLLTLPRSSNYLNLRFSRESWLIDVQPISRIPRSISARIRPRERSTPAWPAVAKG